MPNRKMMFLWILLLGLMPLVLNGRTVPVTAVTQSSTFTDSGQNLGNEWSNDVALGDLDGDVDLDAFVVNSTPASQVWLNQGGEQGGTMGVYQDSGQALSTVNGEAVALGDLDGDLDLDAFVVLSFSADSHQVWINQGGTQGGTPGTFSRNSHIVHDAPATNVVLGDVDGDFDLDAYITRVFDADQLYLNDGTGLFNDSSQLLEAADSQAAAFADVDGDLDLDIFVVTQTANEVWLNQGGSQGGTLGVFADSGLNMGTGLSLDVALADLDGDNDPDAFVANAAANKVWLNQGGAQSGTAGVFADSGQSLGFSGSNDVQLADFDDDGDMDAFVAEASANIVWINQGGAEAGNEGDFQNNGQMLGSSFSSGVALGDVDGDSDLDAFVSNTTPAPNKVYLNSDGSVPPLNPEGWQIQLVESRGDSGHSPAIALDANGYPHIAHVKHVAHPNGSSQRLYHQYWDGVRWQNELVTAVTGFIGEQLALAIDSNSNPHIAFSATGSNALGLTYATWDGSQWQIQVIENEDFGENIDLVLDSNDTPHISYATTGEVPVYRYAFWDGSVWQHQTFADNNTLSPFTSLALDDNGRPYVAYFDGTIGTLKVAHHDGTIWQTSIVDASAGIPFVDQFFSLTVSGSTPALAFYDEVTFDQTLSYAQWDGNSWQTEAVTTVTFPTYLLGNPSLAMDSSGNPHISYAKEESIDKLSLHYVHWDGTQWQQEILDNSGNLAQANSLILDANDTPHIAYYDQTYDDLRYITWGPNWQIRTVAGSGQTGAADVQMQNGIPYVGYQNLANGFVQLAQWDESWQSSSADSVNNPVSQLSLALSPNFQHLSYYDADAQVLRYGRYNGTSWNMQTVDNLGDVGRHNQLLLADGSDLGMRIVYWDESNRRIKLAVYESDVFQLHSNTAVTNLTSGSGSLSATMLPDGNIGIAYYDALNSGLRFAVWQAATATWTDELVDSVGGDIGRLNSVQMDGTCGCPVIAYYDETNDTLKYAYKTSGGWQIETITANAGGITSLALELGLNSRQRARLAYTTANQAHFASLHNNVWQFETIAQGLNGPGRAALALDGRAHLTYPDTINGLQYVFRTATLDVDTAVSPTPIGSVYNPLSPCPLILELFLNFRTNSFSRDPLGLASPTIGQTGLDDQHIFQAMGQLFEATSGGQHYIDLYVTHGAEMGSIGLADPQLLWDAGGTLQNFLPGLEALVTGHGDEVAVSQQMVDDALDIWTRLANVSSPELATVINTELAQSNNLQDFVGLSFDEWAIALGVDPPNFVYLPVISK